MRGRQILLVCLAALWLEVAHAQDKPAAVGEPAAADGGATAGKQLVTRDPFRPFTLDMHPETPVQLTPLQRFEIGQLTLVATVWEMNPPRALVEDSFGMGYIITLGTPIGPNGGLVKAIGPERVTVEERVLDFYGKERIHQVVMETPKEQPNQPGRERK